jgi:TetR/AcrR family transcriptional repressor of nem operon
VATYKAHGHRPDALDNSWPQSDEYANGVTGIGSVMNRSDDGTNVRVPAAPSTSSRLIDNGNPFLRVCASGGGLRKRNERLTARASWLILSHMVNNQEQPARTLMAPADPTRHCQVHDEEARRGTHHPAVRPFNLDDIPTGWYVSDMNPRPSEPSPRGGARSKLLDAAVSIIREKGYAATSVDDLCAGAGVTKGAFFHHFPSKDSLAVAAANHWSELSSALFAAAPYRRFDDPLDRVLGYLDFRKSMLRGEVAEFTCLAGTMLQEVYGTHPDIRNACNACIGSHAADLESDIADAMKLYRIRARWTAESLALHTQAVLQGAFILAKGKGNAKVVAASIDHLRRYVELLFRRPTKMAGRKT